MSTGRNIPMQQVQAEARNAAQPIGPASRRARAAHDITRTLPDAADTGRGTTPASLADPARSPASAGSTGAGGGAGICSCSATAGEVYSNGGKCTAPQPAGATVKTKPPPGVIEP